MVIKVTRVRVPGIVLLGLTPLMLAGGADLEQARKLYNLTQFEQSLKVLQAIPVKDSDVQELIGRNYYMQGEYKKATEALEKAAAADPNSSEIALWAGARLWDAAPRLPARLRLPDTHRRHGSSSRSRSS